MAQSGAARAQRVLLVDDDAVQVRIREAILQDAGMQVEVATDAEAALALLRAQTGGFGAVVTDHVLPGASGSEFVRMLRDVDSDIPIIVVTGMLGAETEYEGLNVTFRNKPVPPADLINTVRSALNAKSE
jgi:DNA-binding NtrC family response regulator